MKSSIIHSGTYSHKAWITGADTPSTSSENNNHRGYPTIQLQNPYLKSGETTNIGQEVKIGTTHQNHIIYLRDAQ